MTSRTSAALAAVISILFCAAAAADQASSPESASATAQARTGANAGTAGATTVISPPNVPVLTGFRRTTLVEGLEHPWSMAWLPDGTLLVTERPGRLRVIREGRLESQPVSGVPELFAEGQGGLLDVAVDPAFAENRRLWFTYSHGTREANRTRVAHATFDGRALSNWRVVWENREAKTGTAHFGSRLAWLPDGTLLVSVGDGGNPPTRFRDGWIREQAQNRGNAFGAIVRLAADGSVPRDNPFVGVEGADPAIWSYGHRNVQGLAVDAKTGQVWATEHGPLGGDELNLVKRGANYGWPEVTHGTEYTGPAISDAKTREPFVAPRLVWDAATAPSGLAWYGADRVPEWRGALFAGGLASLDVRRITFDEQGRVAEQRALRVGQRVRDVRVGPDGLLYVLTDEKLGRLMRFEPSE